MYTLYIQGGYVLYTQEGVHAPVSEGETVHLEGEDYIVVDKSYNPVSNHLEIKLEYNF